MHISEGVLSAPVLIAGAAAAAVGIGLGLRKLSADRMMASALAGAAFFVASLIHVPVGIASAHLILNGLIGILVGTLAYPVIFAALLLQGLIFQFGGVTVLGVNTFTMATGAVLARILYCACVRPDSSNLVKDTAGFFSGAAAVACSALLTALALAETDEGFAAASKALFIAHLPVLVIEGIVTALILRFLRQRAPEAFATLLQEKSNAD